MSKRYRVKTEAQGVYLRTCAKKILPDGSHDQCYDIVFKTDGVHIWEKAGYVSEGFTLEDAIRYRAEWKALLSQPRPSVKNVPTINQIWKRYSRRYPTTYAHIARRFGETEAQRRIQANGKPDVCWDIHYKLPNGRDQWEKVGWVSEGYTVKDAIELYGVRVRALRHPELQPAQTFPTGIGGTIDELWKNMKNSAYPTKRLLALSRLPTGTSGSALTTSMQPAFPVWTWRSSEKNYLLQASRKSTST